MSRPINDDPFRALAHPVRRRILELLQKQPRTAGDLVSNFRMSQPAISGHLRVLRQTRLISERRRGRARVYQIEPRALRTISHWMEMFRQAR